MSVYNLCRARQTCEGTDRGVDGSGGTRQVVPSKKHAEQFLTLIQQKLNKLSLFFFFLIQVHRFWAF